jgi:fumarate hydratase class I
MELVKPILELYRRMSCELPADVMAALEAARAREEAGSLAGGALETILENARMARRNGRPLCQDTGLPVFYVARPNARRELEIREAIVAATREATARGWLRPNAVDSITGRNSGDNTGEDFPLIHFHETEDSGWHLTLDAMLKGGGCENVGMRYKLPDDSLGAARDLEGVRRGVLDAIFRAQGKACPPYVVGVAIGGARDATAALAKRQLLRRIDDRSNIAALAALEARLADEANQLGIGPAGFGGRTTVLAVKLAAEHRPPASFFVEVSFGCWAMRRGRVIISADGARHE